MFIILGQISLTVSISVIGIFLPKVVVVQIMEHSDIKILFQTILFFTIATTILSMILKFLDTVAESKRVWLRTKVSADVLNKTITTDYANLTEKRFIELKQMVRDIGTGYDNSTEQIYECFKKLGINLLGFAVYMVFLVSVNPFVLWITVVSAILGVIMQRRVNIWRFENDYEYSAQRMHLWYINKIGGIFELAKDIRLFKMKGWINRIYNTNMELEFDFRRKERMKQLSAEIVTCFMNFVQMGISYGYLIWAVFNKELSVDNFVLLFAAIGGFSDWITGILTEIITLSKYSLDYCRIREFLEYPDKFNNDKTEIPLYEKGYSLTLKNVSFRYEGMEEYILENINLTVNSNEKLAIVGLNGAGKTTLVKLMCGLYDPTKGQVLLNGKDIREYDRKKYYSLFTVVFQDFNILPFTVGENISQHDEKDMDYKKVKQCLKKADLDKKINSLPQGLNTLLVREVNDEAAEFSGGETQKFIFARALYKDAPIMILDEPTAALDPIAESKLYERYSEFSKGKISVYISHRLASTRFCHKIVLINNKQIIEQGSHNALMKENKKYAELFHIQSKYYKERQVGEMV